MKEYKVVRVNGAPDWSGVEKLAVEVCPWGGEYRPAVFAQAAYETEKGFHVRMLCEEAEPLAVYTASAISVAASPLAPSVTTVPSAVSCSAS